MKRILLLLAVLCSFGVSAQIRDTGTLRVRINSDIIPNSNGSITATKLNNLLNGVLNSYGPIMAGKVDSVWSTDDRLFVKIGGITYNYTLTAGIPFSTFYDSILTRIKYTDTIATVLTKTQGDASYVRIQTQNPNSTLSGGYSYERRASGTFTPTLTWSGGRLAAGTGVNATNPISTIVVGGVSQTFTQPSAGSSVSGTQVVTVTNNTNTTFQNVVTTTDSKSATSSTSFTVYDKRYIGWALTSTPTSAEILAAVYQDNSGGNASINTTLSVIGTARYLFIVNTLNQSSITVNGFPSTAAFSLNNSVSFTNASGGTFIGKYTVSNSPIGNAGSTTLIIN